MGIFSRILGGGSNDYEPARVYTDLRDQVLALADQKASTHDEPIALLMETGMDGGCYSLVSHADGTASLYLSHGGGVIGVGQHRRAAAQSRALVQLADDFVEHFTPQTEPPLPSRNKTRFSLIKPGVILGGEFNEQEMGNGDSPLSPLFHAGHELISMIRFIDDFQKNESQLMVSVFRRDLEQARALLHDGADPNSQSTDGDSALSMAVMEDQLEMAETLLAAGADPNLIGSRANGESTRPALNYAAAGRPDLIDALLHANARLDGTDATGLSALMTAAHLNDVECLTRLLAAGAALEQRDESGYTALMFAASSQSVACVERLLEAGARVDATDHDDSTPLMFAAQHGNVEIVDLLLGMGADPTSVGTHGYSALDFARQNGHADVSRRLETLGS